MIGKKIRNGEDYLPSVAITIASSSLPPLLTVTMSLIFGVVPENSFPESFDRSFLVSIYMYFCQ